MNKEEPKYFEFTQLENVGTEKVGIGYSPRTATYSLSAVAQQSREQQGTTVMHNNIIKIHNDWVKLMPSAPDYGESEINKDKIYIILIRDVHEKWKSGYKEELIQNDTWRKNGLSHYIDNNCFLDGFQNNRPETKKFLKVVALLHDTDNFGFSWMYKDHCRFWHWNSASEFPLTTYLMNPNIYFLDLKSLSHPKFLKWLQEKDEDWKIIKEIPHENKTPDSFWEQMLYFWREYEEGKILKNKLLYSPILRSKIYMNRGGFGRIICMNEQFTVDYIRNYHERYLKFEEIIFDYHQNG
jgi:hypothetical protein